jgi:hypothetical protein
MEMAIYSSDILKRSLTVCVQTAVQFVKLGCTVIKSKDDHKIEEVHATAGLQYKLREGETRLSKTPSVCRMQLTTSVSESFITCIYFHFYIL